MSTSATAPDIPAQTAEESASFSFSKKKPRTRPSALRKRPLSPEIEDAATASTSAVITAPKKTSINHLIQGTNPSKRRNTASTSATAELSDSDEEVNNASSFGVNHSATTLRMRRRSSSPPPEMSMASIKAGQMAKLVDGKGGEKKVILEDGLYHGKEGSAHQLPKAFGPVKGGPGNVRTITLVDYQPDVCKDYKETGFCGFGDTCKFLHDRGDYLQGWQLDNQFLSSNAAAGSFLAKQAARANGGRGEEDSDSENEELPFACLICRKPFGKEPIITLCGHYFDSSCAIKRFAKTGKCFACGKGTNGVFNKATKLINQVKEREKVAAAAALEEKEFEEDDETEGIAIEGLRTEARTVVEQGSGDDGSGSEEEAPKPVKRRPIIEIQ